MKTMIMLRAAAMMLTLGISSAYAAAEGDRQSISTLFTSVQAQHQRVLQQSPLLTIGGVEVRVWAPVVPSYNAEADGDLAARNIWGAG